MIPIRLSNLLPFCTPIIFLYLIIYLGWKNSINTFIHAGILIGIVLILSIFHLLIFFEKNHDKGYQSMTFLSFFILIPSLIFSILKIFSFQNDKIIDLTDIELTLLVSLSLYVLIRIAYFMRIIIYVKIHNPAFIFITSFVFLSFLGSIFLMLPSSTVVNISFIDALFTSTSAVCVTGLEVLNTSKDFTHLGKVIILTLVELGGLGILTITSFFSYFFRDGFSFREGIYISNFLNTKTTNNVLSLSVKVVIFTLIVETIGTLLIYLSIKEKNTIESESPLFFSIFHSISAFCNGGFSTLSQGLYSESVRFNYLLQFFIACLLILGGIGFNIVFNFFTYVWLTFKKYFYKIFFQDEYFRFPVHIVTLNTKIVLWTTFLLLFFGTIFYYISEYQLSLSEHHSFIGKLVVSFFSSATSRTAGFQVLNMNDWGPFTILFTIFLMWIGASPASTGGGIKTSTFALALMNIISLSRGKERLEILKKEISSKSVRLAFAIIILSLIIIYISIFIILFLDPKEDILSIAFEVFSAFSTVGLSLGITSNLSNGSKLVLIILMLLGRIGVFNIMIGLLKNNRIHSHYYKYPQGNIFIN
ncbi:MAG: potassium transporter [Flavobacteriales bacterium]|jgi:potassium uptake TrkH family protein|uniref:TrkH family potassium uptake protein n=1 Tax=Blattabacterium sp. (Mastotermes darwiniensis) TaxID=39768 RepID=UPI000231DE22|nr:potassium transporter TrkG [Blattabacterium sp. (Mastotermes darwiniensis)]AER40598.1 K+ uptake transporter subunit KtrB [Blattabacterium sp. (Mastotermes darwiniensis) str. MADAR]MDR1805095.1 potassium transporter [Flavobacteriales bacterium]